MPGEILGWGTMTTPTDVAWACAECPLHFPWKQSLIPQTHWQGRRAFQTQDATPVDQASPLPKTSSWPPFCFIHSRACLLPVHEDFLPCSPPSKNKFSSLQNLRAGKECKSLPAPTINTGTGGTCGGQRSGPWDGVGERQSQPGSSACGGEKEFRLNTNWSCTSASISSGCSVPFLILGKKRRIE